MTPTTARVTRPLARLAVTVLIHRDPAAACNSFIPPRMTGTVAVWCGDGLPISAARLVSPGSTAGLGQPVASLWVAVWFRGDVVVTPLPTGSRPPSHRPGSVVCRSSRGCWAMEGTLSRCYAGRELSVGPDLNPRTGARPRISSRLPRPRPGGMDYVTTAEGGHAHLSAAMFEVMAEIKLVPVPYKNTGTPITGPAGGQVGGSFPAWPVPIMRHRWGRQVAGLGDHQRETPADAPSADDRGDAAGLPDEAVYCVFAPAKMRWRSSGRLNREDRHTGARAGRRQRAVPVAGREPRASTPAMNWVRCGVRISPARARLSRTEAVLPSSWLRSSGAP